MENLATRIRRMREHRNLTQEYVAEQLGISARTYRHLEHKDGDAARLLTLQRLLALADVLHVRPEALLFDEPDVQSNVLPPPQHSRFRCGNQGKRPTFGTASGR